MPKPRLFWKLLAALGLTGLFVLMAVVLLVSRRHEQFVIQEQQAHLAVLARVAARDLEPLLAADTGARLQEQARRFDEASGARVTVIRPDGEVLGDSRRDPAALESHLGRPEVARALAGELGQARRYSTSTAMPMVYVALPLAGPEGVRAVVRLAVPERDVQALVDGLGRRVWLVAAVVLVAVALVSTWLSWQLSRPLQAMRRVAHDLAEGRAEAEDWPQPDTRETAALAEALRRMSNRLRDKIADVEELLAEQKTVLASMVDGVLLVDRDARVVDINRAAATWFGCHPGEARGRNVLEVVRHPRLHDLVQRTLAGPGPVEGHLVLHGPREVQVQVHGAPVTNGTGRVAGVLVLSDVTRLRELEKAHRDFVANASHELKTPVTAIQGFAENLAGDDLEPEQVKKFAGIVARQARQLTTLVEDLLELTRLEHQHESGPLERERIPVAGILWAAVETCTVEAQEKDITLRVQGPEDLEAELDVPLIQRALTNLVDNAIKYSPAHTTVTVTAGLEGEQVLLSVRDQGPGIAPEHQARIFDRFYRVDKSRSRKLGGTGLGLSIVRHAAEAHGGTVGLESAPGKGSTFTLRLPRQAPVQGG